MKAKLMRRVLASLVAAARVRWLQTQTQWNSRRENDRIVRLAIGAVLGLGGLGDRPGRDPPPPAPLDLTTIPA